MVTKVNKDVLDVSDVSKALANDSVAGGIKEYVDVQGLIGIKL